MVAACYLVDDLILFIFSGNQWAVQKKNILQVGFVCHDQAFHLSPVVEARLRPVIYFVTRQSCVVNSAIKLVTDDQFFNRILHRGRRDGQIPQFKGFPIDMRQQIERIAHDASFEAVGKFEGVPPFGLYFAKFEQFGG